MVMRQQTGGSTTSHSGPVPTQIYQDLQPTSEWKQEEGCAVLVVHLSGFTKKRLGIQLHNMDRLRVCVTPLARDNTWIRFDQTFPIPEDCTTSGIQAKFLNGILYVTFQKKKNITQVRSKEVKDFIPAKPSPSIIGSDQQRDERHSQFPSPQQVSPPTASTSGGGGKRVEAPSQLKPEDDEDINLRKASTSRLGDNIYIYIYMDANNMEALSSDKALSNKPEAKKDGEDQRQINSTSEGSKNAENVVGNTTAGEERDKTNHDDMEKPSTAPEKSKEALGKVLNHKQTESSEKRGKESKLTAENVIQKRVGTEKMDGSANGLDQNAAIDKYSNATKRGRTTKNAVDRYAYGKYKQIVKDFIKPKDEEERKLLVTKGAAALVIVAVGAYITYSRWSSEKPKNQ